MTTTVIVANEGTPYKDARIEREVFAETDVEIILTSNSPVTDFLQTAADAQAIINPPHPTEQQVFEALDGLQIIATPSVGVDHIDVDAATDHGVFVVNTPGYCAEEVAVHAFSLLLACRRKIVAYSRDVETGEWSWQKRTPIRQLKGQTLGLAAFGAIAQELATIASGFDMNIVAHDPYVPADEMAEHGVEKVAFNNLLARSDAVSVHTPLTEETRRLFGASEFESMKEEAILVNTSRGEVVDQAALYEALVARELASAGLDVLEQEPPSHLHLFELDNVVLSPHAGAYSEEAHDEARRHAAEEVVQALSGHIPDALVNEDLCT